MTINAVPYMDICEQQSRRIHELEKALADLLPYATACVGIPRSSWPADSVILRAEMLLGLASCADTYEGTL